MLGFACMCLVDQSGALAGSMASTVDMFGISAGAGVGVATTPLTSRGFC